jgi:DNA-binding GntR family transcriptional regulator
MEFLRTGTSEHPTPSFLSEPLHRVSATKADVAYAEIRSRILSCDLPPGSVIDQDMLAEWLGSSITPVREALRRLGAEQLVLLNAHREVRVAPVSMDEFREFHIVRLGLEPLAAEQAASRATEEDIAMLRGILAGSEPASDAAPVDLDRSRMFHRAIYAASRNRTVTQILDNTWDCIARYRVLFARVGKASSCNSPEHREIVAAIAAGKSKEAGDLIRADLAASFEQLESVSEDMLETIGSLPRS